MQEITLQVMDGHVKAQAFDGKEMSDVDAQVVCSQDYYQKEHKQSVNVQRCVMHIDVEVPAASFKLLKISSTKSSESVLVKDRELVNGDFIENDKMKLMYSSFDSNSSQVTFYLSDQFVNTTLQFELQHYLPVSSWNDFDSPKGISDAYCFKPKDGHHTSIPYSRVVNKTISKGKKGAQ